MIHDGNNKRRERGRRLKLNQKGQGLTEYGIILLLILGVGMGLWFHWNPQESVGAMYSTIASDVRSIVGEASGYEDDLETFELTKARQGNGTLGPFTFHKTSLSFAGQGYNGSKDQNNGNANDQSIWWFINSSGYKEYKVGKGNVYGTGMLQEVPKYVGNKEVNSYGYNITDTETYTYFKATDGNTYQVTYYKDDPTGTTITQYTGDPKSITCVDSKYAGYSDGKQRYT